METKLSLGSSTIPFLGRRCCSIISSLSFVLLGGECLSSGWLAGVLYGVGNGLGCFRSHSSLCASVCFRLCWEQGVAVRAVEQSTPALSPATSLSVVLWSVVAVVWVYCLRRPPQHCVF